MSQATIYNLARNDLTPGPKLTISTGTDSFVKASMDFRCVKGDLSSDPVQAKLQKGTLISVLYPDIGLVFNFLQVDGYSSSDESGGITVVTVMFKGVDIGDDSQFDGKDVTYSRNDALQEEHIFNNPNYIKFSDDALHEHEAIRLSLLGILYAPIDDEPYNLRYLKTDQKFLDITSPEAQEWYRYIVIKGNHTWNAPVSEWTKSATGKSQLSDSALSDFGWIDTPPGNPAAPAGHDWQFSGATENITLVGDGANSYSLSWTSGRLEERVYKKPTG